MERNQNQLHVKESVLAEISEVKALLSTRTLPASQPFGQQHISDSPEDARNLSESFQRLAPLLDNLKKEADTTVSNQRLLEQLHFAHLHTRRDNIAKAHRKTFEWILEPPENLEHTRVKFVEWLRCGDGTFWIQGKAGSGKSTLMKFITQHPPTTQYLREWAGPNKLVVASHYFWAAGTELQKSQEGLLRSLLFELLRACPELIAPIRDKLLAEGRLVTTAGKVILSRVALLCIFEELMTHSMSTRFCFFIDGLDEYTGVPEDLLGLVDKLSRDSNIKICLSSRPHAEFVRKFEKDKESLLKLEDLTKEDIREYVKSRLNEDERYRELVMVNSEYETITEQVVKRAQGVFLWVSLVVRSLLEGAQHYDSLNDMQKRLDTLPTDLEDLFKHMLQSISPMYLPQAAWTFQIALAARGPLGLRIYEFAERIIRQPRYALDLQADSFSDLDELNRSLEQLRCRLDARCKGLLEVVPTPPDEAYLCA